MDIHVPLKSIFDINVLWPALASLLKLFTIMFTTRNTSFALGTEPNFRQELKFMIESDVGRLVSVGSFDTQ